MDIENLTRWVHASIALYFKHVGDTAQYKSLVEGIEERTPDTQLADDRFEIRMNGPFTTKFSGVYDVIVSVNILVTSNFGEVSKDAYKHDRLLGKLHQAMDAGIPIFNVDLADTQIGCLSVVKQVKVYHFEQVTPDDRVKQGMVTATYQMSIDR